MQNQSPKVHAQNFLWNEPNEKVNLIKSNEERANGQQKYMTPQIRNKIQTQIPRRIRKTRAYHVQQMEKKVKFIQKMIKYYSSSNRKPVFQNFLNVNDSSLPVFFLVCYPVDKKYLIISLDQRPL